MTDNLEKPVTFHWTATRRKAAVLVAADDLTNGEIAAQLGIAPSTLSSWKARSEFMAEVGDHIGQLQAAMLRYRIAKKRERLKVLDRLHEKLLTVVEERAEDMAGDAPGTGTGMVVKQIKSIGVGPNTQIIEEYAVDNATARQIMALQEQAAKELGQWVERTATEDLTRIVEIVGVPADAL